MSNTTVIKNADWVIGWDKNRMTHYYQRRADVVFSGSTITHVGKNYQGDSETQIDGKGLCVMPGLINIHAHPFTEIMNKGVLEGSLSGQKGEFEWFKNFFSVMPDPKDQLVCAEVGFAELLKSGVTTLTDISVPFPGWIDLAERSGLRAYLAPMFTSTEGMWEINNGFQVKYQWAKDGGKAQLNQALEIVDAAINNNSSRLNGMIMPAQIDTCSEELLRDSILAANERNIPIQIHAAQFMSEFREITKRFGVTPIEYLNQIGLLSPAAIVSHAIFFDHHELCTYWGTQIDLEIFKESGASVAHCPTNYARTWGFAMQDFKKYKNLGINIAIGTDTYPHNMIEEIRMAFIIGRVVSNHYEKLSTVDVFNAATIGGARALNREDIGRLEPGAKADIVLVDLDHVTMKPVRDPLKSLIFQSAERAVKDVYIDGSKVVSNGSVLNLDYSGKSTELDEIKNRIAEKIQKTDDEGRNIDEIIPLSLPLI
jgi:5-methylthioadenosine/S-adenosylhomocysteine deaminase